MREVKFVSRDVPASTSSWLNMRNEMRAMVNELGLPSFYVTINPADVYNPLVKFLAGSDIDIDNLLLEQVPNPVDQSILIANNPAVAARFFNIFLKAFISCILGYENDDITSGVLGVVKGYYGCVEAQGRGSLHCHMLVWVEGGFNPNEIRDRIVSKGDMEFASRLLLFLDDTISNCLSDLLIVPEPTVLLWSKGKPPNPCAVRDIIRDYDQQTMSDEMKKIVEHYDLRRLTEICQQHRHSHTCYKYCKPSEPKHCRFDLDKENVRYESSFDSETGRLCLRCMDSLVNNFNETILRTIQCNMDIQFVGSGNSAKAVVYYITDYIAKAQLKTHVAYAALELALKKLDTIEPSVEEATLRAKCLLHKCVFSILANQELSAQQVALYNMGLEDHFTSHKFHQLYWAVVEDHLNPQDLSPECYALSLTDACHDATCNRVYPADTEGNRNSIEQTIDESQLETDIVQDHADEYNLDVDAIQDMPDEFTISTDMHTGVVVPLSTQLQDYVHRPSELSEMCFWDFASQTEKISCSRALYWSSRSVKISKHDIDDSSSDSDNETDGKAPDFE